MRRIGFLIFALLPAATFTGGPAQANMCQTDHFSCATAMPLGGYCECTSRGNTESGDVVSRVERRGVNATAGGCGAHPEDPGCRNERGR
ncbi:MAG: hypothetical protein JO047_15175 [Alphaproteobacteria bacterium]|nr:hypothetical protein [Alphaproteobacteria bacterium]